MMQTGVAPVCLCHAAWANEFVVKSARHDVGTSIAVHHNDTDPELIVRQFKNMGVDDLAPFGLSVETYEFKGSFLSLAIDLPSEAATGLTKTTFLKWKANCHWITQCPCSCG